MSFAYDYIPVDRAPRGMDPPFNPWLRSSDRIGAHYMTPPERRKECRASPKPVDLTLPCAGPLKEAWSPGWRPPAGWSRDHEAPVCHRAGHPGGPSPLRARGDGDDGSTGWAPPGGWSPLPERAAERGSLPHHDAKEHFPMHCPGHRRGRARCTDLHDTPDEPRILTPPAHSTPDPSTSSVQSTCRWCGFPLDPREVEIVRFGGEVLHADHCAQAYAYTEYRRTLPVRTVPTPDASSIYSQRLP
eukprot:Sspe_Gene.14878::Locus_5164_Transcript_2_4_Confidence_0.333_Length_3336::g.14878::m.14878